MPVLANGDITTPQQARHVLDVTGADAVMIGRGAQGRPWIFREIAHYLATGELLPEPEPAEVAAIMLGHLQHLHAFYGEPAGVRIARKHLGWYLKSVENCGPDERFSCTTESAPGSKPGPPSAAFRQVVNRVESASEQLRLARDYFATLQQDWRIAA
jgi:tRNA-dihydrouridine synthase B